MGSRIAVFGLIHFVAVVYRVRPAYFVLRGQVMAQFVIRGQDMLKLRSGADCSGAENKALAVANFCFNWPNYGYKLLHFASTEDDARGRSFQFIPPNIP
jgi:hypothetical protein